MAGILSFLNDMLPIIGGAAGTAAGPGGMAAGMAAGDALSKGFSSLGAPPMQPQMGAMPAGNKPQVAPISLPQLPMTQIGQLPTPQANPSIPTLIQGLMAARGS